MQYHCRARKIIVILLHYSVIIAILFHLRKDSIILLQYSTVIGIHLQNLYIIAIRIAKFQIIALLCNQLSPSPGCNVPQSNLLNLITFDVVTSIVQNDSQAQQRYHSVWIFKCFERNSE